MNKNQIQFSIVTNVCNPFSQMHLLAQLQELFFNNFMCFIGLDIY